MSSYTNLLNKRNIVILLFLFLATTYTFADKDPRFKKHEAKIDLYQGFDLGVELYDPISQLFQDSYGYSFQADVDLWHKYIPTITIGYNTYTEEADNGISFSGNGYYTKIGINKPIAKYMGSTQTCIFTGLHLGYTSFNYSFENVIPQNPGYWNTTKSTNYNDEKASCTWLEIPIGVKFKITGPISLGWTVIYKRKIDLSDGINSSPAYIPGFGKKYNSTTQIRAYIYYRL